MVGSVPIGDKLFIGGDLNGHMGTSNTGFKGAHGALVMAAGIKKDRMS